MLILEMYNEAVRGWTTVATMETVASVIHDPDQEAKNVKELLANLIEGKHYRVVKILAEKGGK